VVSLIFLGPPGAGKGTQAALLANRLAVPHISTGDILRNSVAQQTDLGVKAQSYMDRGELVPDELIINMVRDRISQPDAADGWILDGFPRNVSQAKFLNELLDKVGHSYDLVVNLDVPDEILVSRLLQRGRKDDSEDVIRHRLEVYRNQTEPLISFYSSLRHLVTVNGNQPVETVTDELHRAIQS
jgi:adenylate kinase